MLGTQGVTPFPHYQRIINALLIFIRFLIETMNVMSGRPAPFGGNSDPP